MPVIGVPVTETFEPVAKPIVPPVVQVVPTATSAAPASCTWRLVMDPPPRTNPLVETCTTPAAPSKFKLAEFAAVVPLPFTIVFPQLVREPPVGMLKVPFKTVVVPL